MLVKNSEICEVEVGGAHASCAAFVHGPKGWPVLPSNSWAHGHLAPQGAKDVKIIVAWFFDTKQLGSIALLLHFIPNLQYKFRLGSELLWSANQE